MTKKPRIVVVFYQDVVDWFSDGWSEDKKLMAAAKKAIRDGETPEEVIENLEKTFEVVEPGVSFEVRTSH